MSSSSLPDANESYPPVGWTSAKKPPWERKMYIKGETKLLLVILRGDIPTFFDKDM